MYFFRELLQLGHFLSFIPAFSHSIKHTGWKIWKQMGVIITGSPTINSVKSIVQAGSPLNSKLFLK